MKRNQQKDGRIGAVAKPGDAGHAATTGSGAATGRSATRRGPRPIMRIGVIVPGNIDFGRSVLQGVRIFCNDRPDTRLILLSSYGYSRDNNTDWGTVDCLVFQESEPAAVDAVAAHCPHTVVTSNKHQLPGRPRVINDDIAIGRAGAQYFLQRGYRNLAFVSASSSGSTHAQTFQFAVERQQGFAEAAADKGVSVNCFNISSPSRIEDLLRDLLALPRPLAVMTCSDLHARWIIEALDEPNKLIPGEIAILGVDDDALENALSPLGISSVRPTGVRIGYEAAAMGLRLAAGGSIPERALRIAPRDIVTRTSTSVYAIKDAVVVRALRLMRDQMANLPDAATVAQELGIARRTMEVRLQHALGTSPARQLLQTRIDRARELLAGTDLSIKEIAYLVGFSEPRMLSRCFREETGERPSDYRERILADKIQLR